MSLLFEAGERPTLAALESVLAGSSPQGICISHRPHDEDEGWVELLAGSLTFELRGLEPGPAAPLIDVVRGLRESVDQAGWEAMLLSPAAHVAAGAALEPIMRLLLALAATLTHAWPVVAVCWQAERPVRPGAAAL